MASIFNRVSTFKLNLKKKPKDSPGAPNSAQNPRSPGTAGSSARVPASSSSPDVSQDSVRLGEDEIVWEDLRILGRAVAICDYHPADLGSYDDIRFLEFDKGTIIDVLEQDTSGWWEGLIDGVIGVFPGSYVQMTEIMEEEDPGAQAPEEGVTDEGVTETDASGGASEMREAVGASVVASGSTLDNAGKDELLLQIQKLREQLDEKSVLEVRLATAEEENKRKTESLNSELEKRKKLEAELRDLKAKAVAEGEGRGRLEQALKKAEQEAEEAWTAHNALLKQLEARKASTRSGPQEDLSRQLEEEMSRRAAAEEQVSTLELQALELRQQHQRVLNEVSINAAEMEHFKREVDRLTQEKREVESSLDEIKQDLKITRTACVAQSKELEKLTLAHEQLQAELAALRMPSGSHSVNDPFAKQLEVQANEARRQLAIALAEKQSLANELEQQTNQLHRALAAEKTSKQEITRLIQTQQRMETSVKQTKDSTEQELTQLKQRYAQLATDKRKVDEELKLARTSAEGVLAQELQQLRARLDDLKKENVELKDTLDKQRDAQANIIKIESQTTELQKKLDQEVAAKKALEESEKSLRMELGIAQKRLTNASSLPPSKAPPKAPTTATGSRRLPAPPANPVTGPPKEPPRELLRGSPAPAEETKPKPWPLPPRVEERADAEVDSRAAEEKVTVPAPAPAPLPKPFFPKTSIARPMSQHNLSPINRSLPQPKPKVSADDSTLSTSVSKPPSSAPPPAPGGKVVFGLPAGVPKKPAPVAGGRKLVTPGLRPKQ